jgi:hypothetical protein
MSRHGPEANPALLRQLDRNIGLEWIGAANLLLRNRVPGFVERLLFDLRMAARLLVCQPGPTCPRAGQRGFASIADGFPLRPTAGLPPWPSYGLSRESGELLANGPTDVFFVRQVSLTGVAPRRALNHSNSSTPPTSTDRLNDIAASAPGVMPGIMVYEERTIVPSDWKAVMDEREAFRKDIGARYATLLHELQTAGVLTAEEAAHVAVPNLNLEVVEHN